MESTTPNTDTNVDLMLKGQAVAEAEKAAKETFPSDAVGLPKNQPKTSSGDKWEKAVQAMKAIASEDQKLAEDKKSEADTSEQGQSEDKKDSEKAGETNGWEKRYNDLKSHADKTYSKAERLARDLVNRDPEYIHELAKEDKKLADKIVASELGEQGIKTYDELNKALERKNVPPEQAKLMQDVDELKSRLDEKEEKEAEQTVAAFLTEHPDIDEKQAEMIAEMVDEKGLTLDEAYEFSKFKLGRVETESQIREKIIQDLDAQKTAAGLRTSDSMPSKGNSKQLTDRERSFLEGIGATKTLQKYGVQTH